MNPIRRLLLQTLPLLSATLNASAAAGPTRRQPVIFLGHGSPMNALADNTFSRAIRAAGAQLQPKAILVVSAHWTTEYETLVMSNAKPRTIHDFGGFPKALFDKQYPAPGAPAFADKAVALIGKERSELNASWGFDHGTWSVLTHLFPAADVPVFQVSIDMDKPGSYHWSVGKALAELREQGVLIVGSGNIVHNLRGTDRQPESVRASRPWAQAFDDLVAKALANRDDAKLQDLYALPNSELAAPTPEHYWPMVYALGAAHNEGAPTTIYESFQEGTLSMRCLKFGA